MPHTPLNMRQEMLLLARTLLQLTRQEKIKWSATDQGNQFLFSSTKSAMIIQGTFGNYEEEDEGDFSLELLNSGGSVAASIETGLEDVDYGRTEAYQLLKELYLVAQNTALEIDATLEDMHRALGIETNSESTSPDG
jgi:hypothetical protein